MNHNRNVLRLREFESAIIGTTWDPVRKSVPKDVAAEIERFQIAEGREYLSVSRRRITAQNYVGVVGVGKFTIEILPKTDETDDATRSRLVQMLCVSKIFPYVESGIASLASSSPCLLDVFMSIYLSHLATEWRRGRISNYRSNDENRTFLRGKLLFSEQIRKNGFAPQRFFTRADEYLTDVMPSRLLKAGLEICRRFGCFESTRRNATTLLSEFDEVSSRDFTDEEMDAIKLDRRLVRYEPLVALAKLLVRSCVADRVGNFSTFSLLFDMNTVFERFIGNLFRRASQHPQYVKLQMSGKSLLLHDGKRKFALRPDAAVLNGTQCSILIDTKWKRLDPTQSNSGVRQADVYQAYAYAHEYKCPRVVLLYPRIGNLRSQVAAYLLHPGTAGSSRIEIRTVNLSADITGVLSELRQILVDLD